MLSGLNDDCSTSQALRSFLFKQTLFMFGRRTVPRCLLALHLPTTSHLISVYTYINHVSRSSLGNPSLKMDLAFGKHRGE